MGSNPFGVVRNLYFPDVKSRGFGLTRSVAWPLPSPVVAVALAAVLVVDHLAGRPLFLGAEVDLGGQGRGQQDGAYGYGRCGRENVTHGHQCCPRARGA